MLTRVPRGFDADHPAAHWLRYKSFATAAPVTAQELESPKLPDILVKRYAAMLPFVRWFNAAMGLRPQSRR